MPRFKDRTNDRYGRLTVLSYAGKDHRGKHLWLCECDCGKTKEVVSDNLSSGKSKSCGCLKAEFLSSRGNQFGLYENREDAMIKVQYSHMQRRNKKLGFDYSISFDTFKSLVKSPCKYCGIKFSKEIEDRLSEKKDGKRLSDHILKCNGVDRVDIAEDMLMVIAYRAANFAILQNMLCPSRNFTNGCSAPIFTYLEQQA